jgi:hypothetical protein
VVVKEAIVLPDELLQMGAVVVVDADAVGNDYAIIIRPDRYVAAVAKSAEELVTTVHALQG